MDKMVQLAKGNHRLELDSENDWCEVFFYEHPYGPPMKLGALDFKSICTRLHTALLAESYDGIETYERGDQKVFWILSTLEKHHALYGSLTSDSGIDITCQDVTGKLLPNFNLRLDKQDKERWISILVKELQ
jgi:hypothetical protein